MSNYQPYFYVVGWPQLNWYYAGIEIAHGFHKTAHPSNLFRKGHGVRYETSSKLVARFTSWFGDPEVIEIVTLATPQDAALYEEYFLQQIDLKNNKDVWLNRNIRGAIINDDENRKKLSASWTTERRRAQSESMRGKPSLNAGKVASEETRRKISMASKGKTLSSELKSRISKATSQRHLRLNGLEYQGKRYTIPQLASFSNVSADGIRHRLKKGWTVEQAVETPKGETPVAPFIQNHAG